MGEQIDTHVCRQYATPAPIADTQDPDADWNSWQERRFVEMSKTLDSSGALAHEIINEFLESLRSVDPPAGFAKNFAPKFLKDLVDPANCAQLPQHLRGVQLALLLTALEQTGGPGAVTEAWKSLSAEDQARLVELASSEGLMFSSGRTPGLNVRDPMLVIMESVAKSGSSDQALALIRAVDRHSQGTSFDNKYYDYRDHKPFAERAQGLSKLFLAHHDAILNTLTVKNDQVVDVQGNPKKTVSGENLAVLANLLRITALNPDNPKAVAVMDAVSRFTFEQIQTANKGEWARIADKPDPATVDYNSKVDAHNREINSALDRVNKIAGVMHYALIAGYDAVHADEAAQQAFRQKLGEFVIDTALKYLPAGRIAGEEVGRHLSGALGENSVFREALGKAIDEAAKELAAQGETVVKAKFKELVREQLIKHLPENYRYLEDVKEDYNAFLSAITDAAVFTIDGMNSRVSIQEARSGSGS